MKVTLFFLGVSTCNPMLNWQPSNGADTADTSDTGSFDDCANMDLEDVPYAFEGSIPGTADLDSTDNSAKVYFRVNNAEDQWVSTTFWYIENEPGSYLIQLNTTWTSVESNSLFSDLVGYLVMEPITGAVSVVGLSACPEIEGDVVLAEDDRGDD